MKGVLLPWDGGGSCCNIPTEEQQDVSIPLEGQGLTQTSRPTKEEQKAAQNCVCCLCAQETKL